MNFRIENQSRYAEHVGAQSMMSLSIIRPLARRRSPRQRSSLSAERRHRRAQNRQGEQSAGALPRRAQVEIDERRRSRCSSSAR